MKEVLANLLISSPNGGGIFYIENGHVLRVDERSTTGLSLSRIGLAVGVQPDWVQVLGHGGTHGAGADDIFCQDIHDVLWHEDRYYLVGTRRNEVVCMSSAGEECQRWVLPGEEDSCHINCLAVWDGKVVFSAFGDFVAHRGYKGATIGTGFVQELESGRRLITGLSQPHSLVVMDESLLLANSEACELAEYSKSGGRVRAVGLNGYTRGIHVSDDHIYVGLSKSRNAQFDELDSAMLVVLDRQSWVELGRIPLPTDEIYSVLSADQATLLSAVASLAAAACARGQAVAAELQVAARRLEGELQQQESLTTGSLLALGARTAEVRAVRALLDASRLERDQIEQERDAAKALSISLEQALTSGQTEQASLRNSLSEAERKIAALVALRDRHHASLAYRLRRGLAIMRWRRALAKSPLFDAEWYLQSYPDIAGAGLDPLNHYLSNGWREGRRPGPEFDGAYYIRRYHDIEQLDMPPLVHYWLHGRFEGRRINAALDVDWQLAGSEPEGIVTDGGAVASLGQEPLISVIIPTYNRIKLLPAVVASWREVHTCTKMHYEIIFSDDGSEDGSVEYLESVSDLPIKVLRNAHGGASSARNAAIRFATGQRLLIIGDDIFPDPQILNIHADLGNRLGHMVATLGSVDWHEELPVNHLMHHITEVGNEQFSYNRLQDGSYVDFRHFYTCNICVPRHFFAAEQVIFDERFNEYGFEDIELGYRLALRGMKIYFTRAATGEHFHPYKTANFCRRQISAGRMAVVFAGIHPGVRQLIGIADSVRRVEAADPLWQARVDLLVSRCDEYEHLIESLPQHLSAGVRGLLSVLYTHLFRAMYQYGVLQKQGLSDSPLTLAMTEHFSGLDTEYWAMLAARAEQPIRLSPDEARNLGETLITGSVGELLYGHEQRALFDELMRIRDLGGSAGRRRALRSLPHLLSRGLYHLRRNPRHLLSRIRQLLAEQRAPRHQALPRPVEHIPVLAAIPGLVVNPSDASRADLLSGSRTLFGELLQVYELTPEGLLARLDEAGHSAVPVPAADVEATIFFWPKSVRFVRCPDRLLSAFMALIENSLEIAVISHSLDATTVLAGDWRDHVVFSRAMAPGIFAGKVTGVGVTGKVLRLLPAWGDERQQSLGGWLGQELVITEDGFFASRDERSMAKVRYRPPYLPTRAKIKPVVFVLPIFLAVGGVERNTIEIMRSLRDRFDFVVITMERLRVEQGSLAAQAQDVAALVVEMSEIVRHADYLRVLSRLKASLQPDLVWVCNGSPWFCDNASAIRRIFNDIPIIDQEVYDVEQGWINRYNEPGIRSFDHFIAINKKIERRFLDDFGIARERVHLIYSSIDTARIRHFKESLPDASTLRTKFGLPEGKRLYTFIARLTPQKRPIEFLKLALRRLKYEDEFFVLVGDGELAGEAEAFISQHGLHNVKRIPYIANTLELNAIASGIIFTSAYEGLPIAMLEAIAMGVPGFATDVGDIADVLREYGGGEVFPVALEADDVSGAFEAWLARREEYAAGLHSCEDDILERFSSGNIAEQYVACWQAATGEYRRRTA